MPQAGEIEARYTVRCGVCGGTASFSGRAVNLGPLGRRLVRDGWFHAEGRGWICPEHEPVAPPVGGHGKWPREDESVPGGSASSRGPAAGGPPASRESSGR